MLKIFFLLLAALIVMSAFFALWLAKKRNGSGKSVHSRPLYHALKAMVWTGVPAFLFFLIWGLFQGSIIESLAAASVPGFSAMDKTAQGLLIAEIGQVAAGRLFSEPSAEVVAAASFLESLRTTSQYALFVVGLFLAALGAFFALRSISPRTRARHHFERSVTVFMIIASMVAVITTAGIVGSLIYEAGAFFAKVPFTEFLFGTRWEPQIAIRADQVAGQGAFGMLPVLWGTFVIAVLAMLVAVPVGIFSAIYLTEYATERFRAFVKPMLEILAGIPTVVYGFFAVLTVAPMMRSLGLSMGLSAAPNSALAAGGVMGIMLIPFVSSISDDAFAAVPGAMRDGSLAMGATKGETIRKVLFPAALPGIVGGILLALSRAIGETMIVVMAAGLIATFAVNPFESVTTVTVQIVTLLIGDSEFDNPKTLAAFALGLVLFIITLFLNLIALHVVRKYREKY